MTFTSCPACARPLATSQARCFYCGAALPRGADATSTTAIVPSERFCVVIEMRGLDASRLAAALGSSRYEAGLRLARGGPQLHRLLDPTPAESERERLQAFGLKVRLVPEVAVRSASHPVSIRGGALAGDCLELQSAAGPLLLCAQDLICVVLGPIAREYAPRPESNRHKILSSASLEAGYRFHLHRVTGPPLELDPWAFTFRDRDAGRSSLLALKAWLAVVARGAAWDAGFRFEAPALAPAQEETRPELRALATTRREGAREIVDNLGQFRFYSGWRGAYARIAAEEGRSSPATSGEASRP